MSNSTSKTLGQYVKDVFDLNRDGKVTVKEFFSTLMPNQAIAIALLVVDLLALIGEYRVWNVGMHITQNDPWSAAGFVAVSLLPFYLGQILWLYPLATGFQRFLAVTMVGTALVTSVQFGLADLTQQYDVTAISKAVTWLWLGYIVILLLYIVNDRAFKLMRTKIQARANANFQNDMNDTMNTILEGLEKSLEREQQLRARFGDEAVEAHMSLLKQAGGKGNNKPARPAPALPPPSAPQPQKQYPNWELDAFLAELGLNRDKAIAIISNHNVQNPDQFYQWLKGYGVERVDISRKNFNRLYGQLRANGAKNPTPAPRP